jgi:hypothetical protein
VRDAGKPQEPFHILLRQGGEITVKHRAHRKHQQQVCHHLTIGTDHRHQPDHQGGGGDFGNGGDKGGGLVGGALIHIGHPEVKGEDGQLVEKGDQNHQHPHQGGGLVVQFVETGDDVAQIGGAGQPEDIAHAKEHKGRCHHPEEQILHARFHLDAVRRRAAHGHHDVNRETGKFQGHEDGQQFHRGDQHHQPQYADEQKHVIFRRNIFSDAAAAG